MAMGVRRDRKTGVGEEKKKGTSVIMGGNHGGGLLVLTAMAKMLWGVWGWRYGVKEGAENRLSNKIQ